MLNGYNIKLRKEPGQDRQTFVANQDVDLPDTVGVYHKNQNRCSMKNGIVFV